MATTRTVRKPRTTPRVADSGSKNNEAAKPIKPRTTKTTSKATVRKLEQPEGALTEVTYTASELVPVAQYANVSVGPVQITRTFIDNGDPEMLKDAIREMGEVVNAVIAEDRELVEESVRAYNAREKENDKKGARR